MMTIKTFFWVLSFLSMPLLAGITHAETTEERQTNSQTVTLDVQNMTCAMCQVTIKKALQKVDDVQTATTNYDAKTTIISFDPRKTNVNALIKATTDAGYPATVHPVSQ